MLQFGANFVFCIFFSFYLYLLLYLSGILQFGANFVFCIFLNLLFVFVSYLSGMLQFSSNFVKNAGLFKFSFLYFIGMLK